MCIVAPLDAGEDPHALEFLESIAAGDGPVKTVHYLDVRQSMHNGGGPACLRLRVRLSEDEQQAITARVFVDEALERDLRSWVSQHYRDRLAVDDLRDPKLARETMTALDELTALLRLGPVYDFQRTSVTVS
jgi:succinylarginine dihydrolase